MHKIQNRKIIAVFLAFVMLVPLLVVPASAADSGSISGGEQFSGGFTGGTFWDSAYSSMEMPGYGDDVLKALGTLTSSDACASSASGFHSGSAVSIEKPGGRSRYEVHCRCDSCGQGFTVGVTVGELNAAYNSYVSNLPASGFASDGSLLLYLKPTYSYLTYYTDYTRYYYYSPSANKSNPNNSNVTVAFNEADWVTKFLYSSSVSNFESFYYFTLTTPISGLYTFESCFDYSFEAVNASGDSVSCKSFPTSLPSNNSYSEGKVISLYHSMAASDAVSMATTQFTGYILVHVTPLSSFGTTYDIDTRPAPLTGPVGYVDENGEKQVVENTQIVNEVDGIVYNPVTGNSITIDGWNYDYATRTYDGVTSDGMQWAVTYGDGDITLVEGDTVYNIYYLVQSPSADDCQHTYSSTITREATCTMSGVETYTCSTCGDSYTKSIPATGHNWQVLQKVNTEYDETGNLVTQGYTIYQCSVCGEQYKSTDGTAPPSGGSENTDSPSTIGGLFEKLLSGVGDVLGGLIKGVLSLLTKAVDALAGIGELFAHFVENVVGLFGGFTDFLSAVFPFLPEEFFTIFSLGMILLVAAAVLRKFLN